MSYFSTIAGEQTTEVNGLPLAEAEALYAGTETDTAAVTDLLTTFDSAIQTADQLEDSIALDKMGSESSDVTAFGVMASFAQLNLGAESMNVEIELPNQEDVLADPMAALTAGTEAKESFVAKIVRGAKDFIKAIILAVKKAWKSVATAAATVGMNVKKLKDLVLDLEAGKIDYSTAEDEKLNKKLISALGGYLDGEDVKGGIARAIKAVGEAYMEPSSKNAVALYDALKKNADAEFKRLNAGVVADMAKLTGFDVAGPQGADYRTIKDMEPRLLDIALNVTPTSASFTVLYKTEDKKPVWKNKSFTVKAKTNSITAKGSITVKDLQGLAKDLAKSADEYSAQDVVKVVFGRLDDINKDVSEASKGGKTTTIKKMMKYTSHVSAISNKSINGLITNQRAAYSAIKALAQAAE